MLFQLLLCALAGFSAKLVDERADRQLRLPLILAMLAAIAYGAAAGLLSTSSPLSSLFIALAVSALLANKLDHLLHLLGLLAFTVMLLLFPIASFDPWLFALFLVLGLLDELELRLLRPLAVFNEQRLWVPLGALALFLWDALSPAVASAWSAPSSGLAALLAQRGTLFLLAILFFDFAYRLSGWLAQKQMGRPKPVFSRMRKR